jgi:hypothetical protein
MIELGNRTSKMRRAINSLKRKSDAEVNKITPWWHGRGDALEKKMDALNPNHYTYHAARTIAIDKKRALLKKRKKRYEQWGSSRTAKRVGLEALDELMEFGRPRLFPTNEYSLIKGKSGFTYRKRQQILGMHKMKTEVVDGKRRFKDWNEDYAIAKRKFIKARDKKRAKG